MVLSHIFILLLWEYIYRSSQFQWMLLLLLSDILGLLFLNFFIFSWVTFNDYLPFSSYYSVLLFLCLYCSFQGTSLGLLSILDWKCLNKLLLQIFFLTVCFWGILLPTTIFSTFTLLYFLVEPDREKGFHLDVEDYLSGVLILASELVRSLVICHLLFWFFHFLVSFFKWVQKFSSLALF